jgi:hypothetical protein
MKGLDGRSCFTQGRDDSRVDSIHGCRKVAWLKPQRISRSPIETSAEFVDGDIAPITDIGDDAADNV